VSDHPAGLIGQWNGRVTLWLARVAAVILAALAAITFCDVIARYFFNVPFSFTVEVTEIAMGILIYFGIGLATHDSDHITVDILTIRLSDWARAAVGLVTNILALGFCALMVWQLWLRAVTLLEKGDVSPIMHFPRWPTAFVMAAGAVLFLSSLLVLIVVAARCIANRNTQPPPVSSSKPYTD
jgi:TRAP-type C4-dicarboxylate transport system permease small subunit